jgi:hypothetical protein
MSFSEKSFNEKSPAAAGFLSNSSKIIGTNQYKPGVSGIQAPSVTGGAS